MNIGWINGNGFGKDSAHGKACHKLKEEILQFLI
jgi:hypothetical protein